MALHNPLRDVARALGAAPCLCLGTRRERVLRTARAGRGMTILLFHFLLEVMAVVVLPEGTATQGPFGGLAKLLEEAAKRFGR